LEANPIAWLAEPARRMNMDGVMHCQAEMAVDSEHSAQEKRRVPVLQATHADWHHGQ
jgi:hypothetical protein